MKRRKEVDRVWRVQRVDRVCLGTGLKLGQLGKLGQLAELFMNYWLVKQEPESYSFDDLLNDGATIWDGVRNFQARNNLRAMKTGDQVLFYHSGAEKAVSGLAEVSREGFPDPTDENWMAIEIKPVRKLAKHVSLAEIKAEKSLENIALIKQSRLSVVPLSEEEFDTIRKISDR